MYIYREPVYSVEIDEFDPYVKFGSATDTVTNIFSGLVKENIVLLFIKLLILNWSRTFVTNNFFLYVHFST